MATSKMSSLVVRSSIIAALGGLLFGFDTAVISGTTDSLKSVFNLSDGGLGLTVSSALFGTIFGAAIVQRFANGWGRKPTLVFIALLYLISAIGSAFPRMLTFWTNSTTLDWYSFMFFRILGGIGVGGASVVSPLYTAEIAPPKRRGLLVALTQFNIVLGILVAYVSNWLIGRCDFGGDAWRWMFGVEAIPAFIFFLALSVNPESPRWLITKGRMDEALALLKRLVPDQEEAQREFEAIQEALKAERSQGKERFFCWRFRKPIMLAICIAAFNQLSGINAILYYAPTIFRLAGASQEAALQFPIIVGLANFVCTMVALFCIDGFGRKKLMYVGSFGYIISLAVVGAMFTMYAAPIKTSFEKIALQDNVSKCVTLIQNDAQLTSETRAEVAANGEYVDGVVRNVLPKEQDKEKLDNVATVLKTALVSEEPIAQAVKTAVSENIGEIAIPKSVVYCVLLCLMVFIAAHAFGQGACIWVFIGEIFPNAVRAQGQALGSFTHWILNAVVSGLFPVVLGAFGGAICFFMFCGFMVLQLLWVMFLMPETKQIPLEEMQKKLGIE